jgi:serine/threonine protein kinase
LTRWLQVFERVCGTIAHAHMEGIVHRDLKPSNVMVGRFDDVMVMDWGVAAPIDPPTPAMRAAKPGVWVFGTPAYMPPEQARGKVETPDRRSDVFGLGAILCEILTGQPPYVGVDTATVTRMAANGDQKETARRLSECKANPDLIKLARRCLSPDRANRPASATEVAANVRAHLATVVRRARVADKRSQTARERQDRRFVGLMTAILVLAVSVVIGASARGQRARGTDAGGSPPTLRVLTPSNSPSSGQPAPESPRP